MLKTVTIYTCDNCLDDIEDGQQEELLFHHKGRQYTSHWCADCFANLMQIMDGDDTETVTVYPKTCPTCGFVAKTEGGLATHRTRRSH